MLIFVRDFVDFLVIIASIKNLRVRSKYQPKKKNILKYCPNKKLYHKRPLCHNNNNKKWHFLTRGGGCGPKWHMHFLNKFNFEDLPQGK